MRDVLLACAVLGLLACGTIAESNGGDESLPRRGIVGFTRLLDESDDPVAVLADAERPLTDPAALVHSEGVTLYVTVGEDERTLVARAESTDGVAFGELEEVLLPDQVWEGRSLAAPSVLVDDGTLYLWYLGGQRGGQFGGVIGLARSTDGGATFVKEPPPVLFPEPTERFGAPSVVPVDDGRFALFVAVTPIDSEEDPAPSSIVRYDSADGIRWERVGTILEPGVDCVDNEGEADPCWDGRYVREPGARASRSPAGRQLIDLWYTGGLGNNSGLGFAGSYDGLALSRYRLNPILDEPGPESSASVVAVPDGLNLYYTARGEGDRSTVFLAVQRPPEPEPQESEGSGADAP